MRKLSKLISLPIVLILYVGLCLLPALMLFSSIAIAESTIGKYDLPSGTTLPQQVTPYNEPRNISPDTIFLDAETPETGSLLATQPLETPYGTITFVGEVRTSPADPDMVAAGASGDGFDIFNRPDSYAEMTFDFDVDSVTFIYGGNLGVMYIEALDINGNVIDSFFQASTHVVEPAGPITLSGPGICSLFWQDTGYNYLVLDNMEILSSRSGSSIYQSHGGTTCKQESNPKTRR